MPVHRHPVASLQTHDPLANIPLDQALIERMKESYRLMRQNDVRLAEIFYARLFAAAPHLRPLFVTDQAVQSRKLIKTLDSIVENLARPEENTAMLTALGKRHITYGAKPEHYDLVIEVLVDSMAELMGANANQKHLGEWRMALRLISNQMLAATNSAVNVPVKR